MYCSFLYRLSRFILQLSDGNVPVFAMFMCIAVSVVIARSLASYEVLSDDMGVQIEAGYRLVAGLGLTHSSFEFVESLGDITRPIQSKYLTHFPPFLSLYVAGALSLGLSLVTSLKLLFGFNTLVGWVGWAAIGSRILKRPIDLKFVTVPAHFVIAFFLPLFFTPQWQGTDIILWAGTPFVILLLLYSLGNEQKQRYIVAAGLLCGFLYSVRYTSAYLAITAFLIIAQFHCRHIKKFVGLYATFMAASMVFILPTVFYGEYAKEPTTGIAGQIRLDPNLVLGNLKNIIYSLHHRLPSSLSWILAPIPHLDNSLFRLAFGVLSMAAILFLPLFIFFYNDRRKDEKEAGKPYLVTALSLAILSLLLFLILASAFMTKGLSINEYSFVTTWRYYIAIGGSPIFILYWFCSQNTGKQWSVLSKGFFLLFIIGFIVYCLALSALAFLLPNKDSSARIKRRLAYNVVGTALNRTYPSNEMVRPKKTIQVVQQLSAEEPEAILFITSYYNILFDNFNPQLRYFWIGSAKVVLKGAYVSKSTKVYFVLIRGEASAEDFSPILDKAGFQAFMSIPEDGVEIFSAQLPSGFSFE